MEEVWAQLAKAQIMFKEASIVIRADLEDLLTPIAAGGFQGLQTFAKPYSRHITHLFAPITLHGFQTSIFQLAIAGFLGIVALQVLLNSIRSKKMKMCALDPEKWQAFKLIHIEVIRYVCIKPNFLILKYLLNPLILLSFYPSM
jgi:hypothetical protein